MLRQLFWFSVSGVLGLLVDMGVLWLAAPWLGWYGGRLLSFLCAATFTWAFNRRKTFQPTGRRGRSLLAEYLGYLSTMGIGGVVNYATYAAVLQYFAHLPQTPLIGVAAGSIMGLGLNFASARWLVFRRSRDQQTSPAPW